MSNKLVETSIGKLQNTEWIFDRGVLEVRNAVIIFTNFAGQPNRFGNKTKYFNLVLPADLKDFLEQAQSTNKDLKLSIHQYPNKPDLEADEPVLYYINVKLGMNSAYPPAVTLFVNKVTRNLETDEVKNERSKVSLTDDTVGCLDRTDIERVDCKIVLKQSKANPDRGVFYLRQLNVIQTKEPDFGGAYEDWDEEQEIEDSIIPTEGITE